MKKYLKAAYGLWLFVRHKKVYDIGMLKGKRVTIVGPASSAFKTNKGQYIDSFDFVVRVNKSAYVVDSGKFIGDIGKRTDILFHSFFENTESGGGPLDFSVYDKQGISYVINPRNNKAGMRNTFNFYKKHLSSRATYTLPADMYREVCEPLGKYRPTIGFTSLMTCLLFAEFSELYITGFTFYRTPFGDGYRDQMKSPDLAKAFIHEQGIHNIDLEFDAFKKAVLETRKNVVMDDALFSIIHETGGTLS